MNIQEIAVTKEALKTEGQHGEISFQNHKTIKPYAVLTKAKEYIKKKLFNTCIAIAGSLDDNRLKSVVINTKLEVDYERIIPPNGKFYNFASTVYFCCRLDNDNGRYKGYLTDEDIKIYINGSI